jgi:hypothetical protein
MLMEKRKRRNEGGSQCPREECEAMSAAFAAAKLPGLEGKCLFAFA